MAANKKTGDGANVPRKSHCRTANTQLQNSKHPINDWDYRGVDPSMHRASIGVSS